MSLPAILLSNFKFGKLTFTYLASLSIILEPTTPPLKRNWHRWHLQSIPLTMKPSDMSLPTLLPSLTSDLIQFPWLAILVILPLLVLGIFKKTNSIQLPPGPRPLPFLGNLLSLPAKKLHLHLFNLANSYGPLLTLYIGRRPTLVVSSPLIAYELLETRGAKYSSRPRAPVFGELFSRNNAVLVQPYGPSWILRRKLLHDALKPSALERYKVCKSRYLYTIHIIFNRHMNINLLALVVQEAESNVLLVSLLQHPSAWREEISRYTASTIFMFTFGHRVVTLSSPIVLQRFENLSQQNSFAAPGRFLADTFPSLIYMPEWLAPWKRRVREAGDAEARFNIGLVDRVAGELAEKGEQYKGSMPSFVSMLLSRQKTDPEGMKSLDARALAALPQTMFSAGVDTTVSTLQSALLLLLLHPEVVSLCKAEIDNHLQSSGDAARSPVFTDLPQLPYVSAIVQETLRCRPPIPLMIPRSTITEDTYLSYQIPKDTTIFVNTYAIQNSPKYFPSPETFAPQRFLPASHDLFEQRFTREPFPGKYAQGVFGWGRRSCPGAELALNSVSILLAKLIWGFDISREEGDDLQKVTDEGGIIHKPGKFGCRFNVRSEVHREIIEREMKGACKLLESCPPFD